MEFILPPQQHRQIVEAAFAARGFSPDECAATARLCELASWHGIRSHNAIKALHLDHLFGSQNPKRQGCVPNVAIEKLDSPFKAVQRWNANRKCGPAVAFEAMQTAMELADTYGIGAVAVDNAFHYLWGGGYMIDAAKRGYLAYTNCTAALAEVVPFGGKHPTLGTNPHSWGFPTTEAVGFPVVIDWATSTIAMGKVQAYARENAPLPPGSAVDAEGNPTTDASKVVALLPFGQHKGYGLSVINELVAGLIGGSLPTIRSRPDRADTGEKTTPCFYFQAMRPEAMACGPFASGRDQAGNVKAVLEDILGHGNEQCLLPGQIEHANAQRSERAGGLIVTEAEVQAFAETASEAGVDFDPSKLLPLKD